MNLFSMKKSMLALVLTLCGFLTLPAYAWPDVDHMNMCGAPTKVVKHGVTSWADYDRYIAKRGNGYYLRTNCPNVVASKAKASSKKAVVKKRIKKMAKPSKAMSSKRRAKYDEKADCARVDRMNGITKTATVPVRSTYHPNVRYTRMAHHPRSMKRKYNYFKKR